MANRPAQVRQSDATRIFKAAMAAGFGLVRLIKHPDGAVEYVAEVGTATKKADAGNDDWDEVLK